MGQKLILVDISCRLVPLRFCWNHTHGGKMGLDK
jgi:hypothetical protein